MDSASSRRSARQAGDAAPPLVQAVEVWHAGPHQEFLELAGGYYGTVADFVTADRRLRFSWGQGLPGWTAAVAAPVVFADLQTPDFVRHEAADRAGLTSGVGVPVYNEARLTSVILFLCRETPGTVGAFESWLPDLTRRELALGTACYSHLEGFRRLSQYIRFPYGAGLPGTVWQSLTPRVMNRLGESTDFLRAAGAQSVGLSYGVGIPVIRGGDELEAVFVMLSAQSPALVGGFQVWSVDPAKDHITLSELAGPLSLAQERRLESARFRTGEGLIGCAARTRQAQLSDTVNLEPPEIVRGCEEARVQWRLAWPVISRGEVRAVCVVEG